MPRVLITVPLLVGDTGPWLQRLSAAKFDIIFPHDFEALQQPANLIDALAGIDAVLCSVEPYTAEVLAATPLRVVARCGVGYDSIDIAAATQLGIPVTFTPGTNEHSVAEHALAMMLAVSRGFPQRHMSVLRGEWKRVSLPRLAGQTLGLVGLGRIGKALAIKATALGMKVIAFDPHADAGFAATNQIELMPCDEVLQSADYLSLHLPWMAETHHFMNAARFAQMKRGSVFVNTARGGLVDEVALTAALASGQLSAAALDVFEVEPLPLDSALRQFENVLFCPHMAGLDLQSQAAMAEMAARGIVELHAGRWPTGCVVNDSLRSSYRW